jgi:hypothetical protein
MCHTHTHTHTHIYIYIYKGLILVLWKSSNKPVQNNLQKKQYEWLIITWKVCIPQEYEGLANKGMRNHAFLPKIFTLYVELREYRITRTRCWQDCEMIQHFCLKMLIVHMTLSNTCSGKYSAKVLGYM